MIPLYLKIFWKVQENNWNYIRKSVGEKGVKLDEDDQMVIGGRNCTNTPKNRIIWVVLSGS